VSRARIGSFAPPTTVFGTQLSVIHPPDNNFEVVATSADSGAKSPDQVFSAAQAGSIDNEVAILYQALADAQALTK
jgi:hypothetical protein